MLFEAIFYHIIALKLFNTDHNLITMARAIQKYVAICTIVPATIALFLSSSTYMVYCRLILLTCVSVCVHVFVDLDP